jgi:hypothetical protein
MSKVYVILLNWNGEVDTCNCIESLLTLNYKNFDIVICDNQSRQDSIDYIQSFCERLHDGGQIKGFSSLANVTFDAKSNLASPQITLIQTGGNLGFAGGVNVGLKYAIAQNDADYYWILNNDCIATPDSLTALIERTQSDDSIGICGSTLIYEHDRKTVQALGGASYNKYLGVSRSIGAFQKFDSADINEDKVEARMSYVIGASMLVSNALIKKIGMMDERYFLYSEEHDWAYRALLAGYKLALAKSSIIYHKHGASIGSSAQGGSPKSMFYLYRSKIMYTKKFHIYCIGSVALYSFYQAFKFIVKGYAEKSLAIVKGVFAGIK